MNRLLMVAATAGLLSLAGAYNAQAEERPVVVELFTSQGCSSCPPADVVLAEVAQRPDVLALGFHVDYWDNLGWKDPLSSKGATERQNAYAGLFGRRSVFTPQAVVDGKEQLVGSHRDEVLSAITASNRDNTAPVTFTADHHNVVIGERAGGQVTGTAKIIAIRFVRSRATPVQRGENAGHMAQDVNGVEDFTTLSDWNGSALTLPVTAPEAGHGLAVIVQSETGAILGAAQIVS